MQYQDEKLDPSTFEKIAQAYRQSLNKSDINFVLASSPELEQKRENLKTLFSKLFGYIEFLEKTKRAKNKPKQMAKIRSSIELCKQSCILAQVETKTAQSNLCNTLKQIIDISAEIIAICQFVSQYSNNKTDDAICNLSENLLEVIKNSVDMFGECHYRF